eukprot:g5734.t1
MKMMDGLSYVDSQVSYVALDVLRGTTSLIRPLLVPSGGNALFKPLDAPHGMCVDVPRNRLFVTDPGATSRKIFYYELEVANGDQLSLKSGAGKTAALEVAAKWCAVDHVGNLYFTTSDAATNLFKLHKVPASALTGDGVSSAAAAEVLYSNADTPELSAPAGIVSDNYHLYWANEVLGRTKGSIGRAPVGNFHAGANLQLAANSDSVRGVCQVGSHIYFTEQAQNLHAVHKQNGGVITEIATTLVQPRGCAWDGGGSLYIADRQANAVYEVPVSLPDPIPAPAVTKIMSLEDVFDVGVFEPAV